MFSFIAAPVALLIAHLSPGEAAAQPCPFSPILSHGSPGRHLLGTGAPGSGRGDGWCPPPHPPHPPASPLHTAWGGDVRPENHSATRPGVSKVTLKVSFATWEDRAGGRAGGRSAVLGEGPGAADLGVACPSGSGPCRVLGLSLRAGLAAGPLTVEEAGRGKGGVTPHLSFRQGGDLSPSSPLPDTQTVLTPPNHRRGSLAASG